MSVQAFALTALLSCLAGCVVLCGALVVARVVKDRAERRRLRLRGPVWTQVMLTVTGEDDEIDDARARLAAVSGAARVAVVDDAFALVPKLRGAARDRLREVLRDWGLLEESHRLARSRSVVRRCRGVHRIGVLGDAGSTAVLLDALADRTFAVRRTALQAIAAFPDADMVGPALEATVAEPRLRRDFLATMDRIGGAAVPVLRSQLATALAEGVEGERRGHLAAEALGLTGAITAAPALASALGAGGDELRMACLEALGDLGLPASVAAVAPSLSDPSPDVRRAAAAALGRIGGQASIEALAGALEDANVEVARAAAQALDRSGPRGSAVLGASDSPLAREALALAGLGGAR